MNLQIVILAAAFLSLLIGLGLYIWISHRPSVPHFQNTNLFCWLLIALFPVLLIFSFFPNSNFSGTLAGFSVGGAIGAFLFLFWYGRKFSLEAAKADQVVDQLREELEALKKSHEDLQQKQRTPLVIESSEMFLYKLKQDAKKRIGLITGDIRKVTVADIWANSENTNMQMARIYDGSVSGVIRYLGAKKDEFGYVAKHGDDVIAGELAEKMSKGPPTVEGGTVLVTGAGELEKTHNVKKIFHVASVRGQPQVGYRPIDNIGLCVENSLTKADSAEIKPLKLSSILFPLFGTGSAGGDTKKISATLLNSAVSYLETNKKSAIECIYFLAYQDIELEICKQVLEGSGKVTPA